jgi:hypothetical protein
MRDRFTFDVDRESDATSNDRALAHQCACDTRSNNPSKTRLRNSAITMGPSLVPDPFRDAKGFARSAIFASVSFSLPG